MILSIYLFEINLSLGSRIFACPAERGVRKGPMQYSKWEGDEELSVGGGGSHNMGSVFLILNFGLDEVNVLLHVSH